MRTITPEELKTILENHLHWLREDCDGWENMRADLSDCDLSGASLDYASLNYASLNRASLNYASLNGASLNGASLNGASLNRASLNYASLNGASLNGAKNVPFIPYSCPDCGSFIGYKKASGYIVELEILSDSRRLSATDRKCRCDKAKVLSIQNIDGTKAEINSVASSYDEKFLYKVGEIVKVENFDEDRFNECSTGIHFFINRQEAVDY